MKPRVRDISVIVGWGVGMAAIILQALYQGLLTPLDLAILLAISALAGVILLDPGIIIVAYVSSLSLSVLVIFACLTLPATSGAVEHALLQDLIYQQTIIMMTRGLLLLSYDPPIPVIPSLLCLLAALIGGLIGEKLGLR